MMPSSSNQEEKGEYRSCLVCSIPITTVHLGMDICRACASFFKRAKTTGKQYPCRQGKHNCGVENDAKFMCRRCRFDKCIAVGLTYDGPMRERRKAPVSILQRVKAEYKVFLDRRRAQELQIVHRCGCHKRIPHPTEELYNIHESTISDIVNVSILESLEFFKRAFPAVEQLGEREMASELIFKDFMGKMAIAEGYYKTRQIWGGVSKFIMNSVLTCKDMELPMGSDGIDESKFADVELLKSCARMHTQDFHDVLLPIFNRTKFAETEFHALIVLVLSEPDVSCGVSEDALVILDRYRKEILEDLQAYYKNELGLTDYSTRLGNLMSLNHVLQECRSLFSVVIRFYDSMFDLYVTNDMMKRFFL